VAVAGGDQKVAGLPVSLARPQRSGVVAVGGLELERVRHPFSLPVGWGRTKRIESTQDWRWYASTVKVACS
jgi:hypothetical protein